MIVKQPFSSVREFIDILRTRQLDYKCIGIDQTPAVSIISSFYNDCEYFEDAYKSIINQTFQNYEWIIVDDCSTDNNSINLFNSLEKRNSKIKTFRHLENKGPAAGRNKAVSYAKGKYLFFLDTDDIIEPTYIEKCVLFLETHPEFSLVNSYSVGFQEEEYWWSKGFNTPNKFITKNLVTGRVLYRKTDFEKLGGYDEILRYGEDWDLWLKAFSNHQKAYTIPEYLDCYRRRKFGLSEIACQDSKQIEKTKNLLQSRYSSFFKNTDLQDIILSSPDCDLTRLHFKIDITNLLSCENKGKRIVCLLPNLKSEKRNKFFLKILQELKQKNYSITIIVVFCMNNKLHSEFYAVTPDIFYLCNLFDYFNWISFISYIIISRNIDLILICNFIYLYYLLPKIKKQHTDVSFISFEYCAEGQKLNYVDAITVCQYSTFLNAKIVNSHELLDFYHAQNYEKQEKEKSNIYYINSDQQFLSLELIVERLETIFKEATKLACKNVYFHDKPIETSQETLIWVHRYLKIKQSYNEFINLQQELDLISIWSKNLEKERDIYKNQAQAWMKVAKLNQLDLKQTESELAFAQELIDQLMPKSRLD